MNITYLIGNGFDINIGLATRYCDFYEYYKQQPSSNKTIAKLKNDIRCNYENWADLEVKLGEYTANFLKETDFESVFEDIQDRLSQYLEKEQKKFQIEKKEEASKKFRTDLYSPYRFLLPADEHMLNAYINENKSGYHWKINIITFNYTNSIELLLKDTDKILYTRKNGTTFSLGTIEHIHGFHNHRMVLGVNDVSQIANEQFRESRRITDAIIKPQCNSVQKHLVDRNCIELIKQSHIICVYGSSIGDTDKIWWETIGQWLVNADGFLIIFYRDNEQIHPLRPYKIGLKTESIIDLFLSKTNLAGSQKNKCRNRVIIGYETDIFNLSVK